MALYEQKWWQKLFGKKEHKEHVDSLKDIEAIGEFLLSVNADSSKIIKQLEELEELEKERQVAVQGTVQINLEAQAALFDKLLENYESFQSDTDINGLRLKAVAKNFLKEAEKAGMKDLVNEKKKDNKWQFWW